MIGQEHVEANNISATTAGFNLKGGAYAFDVTATFGGGSVGLDILLFNTTWVTASFAPKTTAGNFAPIYLPPGQYRFSVATATAVYVSITRIPGE